MVYLVKTFLYFVNKSVASTDPTKKLDFKTTKIFKIIRGLGVFGGDIIKNDGTGGESIYGMVYKDENFTISHDSRFLMTTVKPRGTPHTNNS